MFTAPVGLQAIVINFCIDSDETRFFGLETHVCEMQLVLSDSEQVLALDHAPVRSLLFARLCSCLISLMSRCASLICRVQYRRSSNKKMGYLSLSSPICTRISSIFLDLR